MIMMTMVFVELIHSLRECIWAVTWTWTLKVAEIHDMFIINWTEPTNIVVCCSVF